MLASEHRADGARPMYMSVLLGTFAQRLLSTPSKSDRSPASVPFEAACSSTSTTYGQLHSWSFPLACPCSVRRRVGPHSPRVMLQVQVNGRGPTRRLLKTRLVWASKGMHPGSDILQLHKSCAWHPCRARLLELSKTTCHAAMHRVHPPSSAKTGATLEQYTCPRAALDP
jgi:hypothetical protein